MEATDTELRTAEAQRARSAIASYLRRVEPLRLAVNHLLNTADPILRAARGRAAPAHAAARMDRLERHFAAYTVDIAGIQPAMPRLRTLQAAYAHTYLLEDAYLSALAAGLADHDLAAERRRLRGERHLPWRRPSCRVTSTSRGCSIAAFRVPSTSPATPGGRARRSWSSASGSAPRVPCGTCPVRDGCPSAGGLTERPARGRQRPFEGSLRQRRGRLLRQVLAAGSVPADSADRGAAAGLVKDGLIVMAQGCLLAPE